MEQLLALCQERSVATQTIKSVARRRWTDSGRHFSWYEPLVDEAALDRAARYALGRPGLFLITSSDAHLLRPTLAAAAGVGVAPVPTDEELAGDVVAQAMEPLFDGSELERVGPA
ncbi:MAG: hypothetical protein ACRDIL_20815 [Candidatus Limnocylindrales bacterium]